MIQPAAAVREMADLAEVLKGMDEPGTRLPGEQKQRPLERGHALGKIGIVHLMGEQRPACLRVPLDEEGLAVAAGGFVKHVVQDEEPLGRDFGVVGQFGQDGAGNDRGLGRCRKGRECENESERDEREVPTHDDPP